MRIKTLAGTFVLIWLWCSSTVTADTITLVDSDRGRAEGIGGVLHVHRDYFRNGWWGWIWETARTDTVSLSFGLDGIPDGSVITSAVLSWEFYDFASETTATLGNDLFPSPEGRSAQRPRCLGIGCSRAEIGYWDPFEQYWGSEVALSNGMTHGFQDYGGGTIDLLSVFSPDSLLGDFVTFSGTVLWRPGRPFYVTEGRNADTEWDVYGYAQANVGGNLVVSYIPPAPEDPPRVPEPGLLGLLGFALTGLAYRLRRRQ